jgi:hypothetical protein
LVRPTTPNLEAAYATPAPNPFDAGARGGVDDRAAALLEHEPDLVFQTHEHAAQIDGEDPVLLVLAGLGGWLGSLLDAGVVEGDVEAPEFVDRGLERGLHVLRAGHVTADRDRAAAGLLDQAGRLPVSSSATSATTTPAPARANASAVARPMPLAAPGDERDLARQLPVVIVRGRGHGRRLMVIVKRLPAEAIALNASVIPPMAQTV